MIAGLLPNTPANLVLWLRHPQSVTPGNAMPDLGLTETQARDIAAYLYAKH
jgi:cytochrome c1